MEDVPDWKSCEILDYSIKKKIFYTDSMHTVNMKYDNGSNKESIPHRVALDEN